MNSRLQQFLEIEQLTPAQFADKMGVQRSNISHLLSGRNKPGYDFIVKFFKTFPHINPQWMLMGKGKPFMETDSPATSNKEINTDFTDTLFDNNRMDVLQQTPDISLDTDDKNAVSQPRVRQKDVRRITLYYSDGTFQEFFPK